MNELKGCGEWLRLLTQGNAAGDRLQRQKFYHLAHEHHTQCETCRRMNMPLVELFFNHHVIVTKGVNRR